MSLKLVPCRGKNISLFLPYATQIVLASNHHSMTWEPILSCLSVLFLKSFSETLFFKPPLSIFLGSPTCHVLYLKRYISKAIQTVPNGKAAFHYSRWSNERYCTPCFGIAGTTKEPKVSRSTVWLCFHWPWGAARPLKAALTCARLPCHNTKPYGEEGYLSGTGSRRSEPITC